MKESKCFYEGKKNYQKYPQTFAKQGKGPQNEHKVAWKTETDVTNDQKAHNWLTQKTK